MFESGSMWAGIITGGINQIEHTKSLANGKMKKCDYAVHTTGNVSGAVGVMAGVEYGAALGSALLPGIGSLAGSIIGGLIGNQLGRLAGYQAGNLVKNSLMQTGAAQQLGEMLQNPAGETGTVH